MKKLLIVSALLLMPCVVSAATYVNKTSSVVTISKKSECNSTEADCICVANDPCMKTETVELPHNESVEFKNDQDQPVTIMSESLNEKREFFPTNNSFNYDITDAKYSSKFQRLTINRAQ